MGKTAVNMMSGLTEGDDDDPTDSFRQRRRASKHRAVAIVLWEIADVCGLVSLALHVLVGGDGTVVFRHDDSGNGWSVRLSAETLGA
eukprot:scaffold239211_cov17-Prasinocladus_malaysianus.AAC.1